MLSIDAKTLIGFRYFSKKINNINRRSKSTYWGNQRSRKRGHGIEFNQARPYVNGDDIRHIDWRISARKQRTHTREFHQDLDHSIFTLVDLSHNMCFASQKQLKSVQAASIASAIGWSALENKYRIGGIIHSHNHQRLKPTLSQKRYCHWLGRIADSTVDLLDHKNRMKATNWHSSLSQCLALMPSGSRLFIIGELFFLDKKSWDLLRYISHYNQINAIQINDPLEQHFPINSWVNLSDGKNNYRLNPSPKNIQNHFVKQREELEKQFTSIGASIQFCLTTDDLSNIINY